VDKVRALLPRALKKDRVMTKADFGDFTYVSAALVFLVIAMVFVTFIIEWQRKE
jgi:hypothetical protein